MNRALRLLPVLVMTLAAACGGGRPARSAAPALPPSVLTTRVIAVSGDLTLGDVPVGGAREATITVTNAGNATLTVTGVVLTGGLAAYTTATWTSGTIAAGGSQRITIKLSPLAEGAFRGTLIVNGDQTGGSNRLPMTAKAVTLRACAS